MSNVTDPAQPAAARAQLFSELLRQRGIDLGRREMIPRRPNQGMHRLSFAQRRVWFIENLEPGTGIYNVPIALRVEGPLDPGALSAALMAIVRRHEVFRSRFESRNGEPAAIIGPCEPTPLKIVDLSSVVTPALDRMTRKIVCEQARQPFDLNRGPVWRATLLRISDREHIVVLVLHHIICDGWSMSVLVRELGALYDAYLGGKPAPFPEQPVQYGDFAEWQWDWLRTEEFPRQLQYWKAQLEDAPEELQFPWDRPRPSVATHGGRSVEFDLPADLSDALRNVSRREGLTLFMTLLAGLVAVLFRYSAQEDLVLGTPIANRTLPQIEGLIGFFVNTLALRIRVRADVTFRELLKQARETTLGGYAHQDLPFETLVEELRPERHLARAPLLQVIFGYQNTPPSSLQLKNVRVEPVEIETTTAKVDLLIMGWDAGRAVHVNCNYNTDIADQARIERFSEHWRNMLHRLVEDPEMQIGAVDLLSAAERRLFLVEWKGKTVAYPRESTIPELFAIDAERWPERVAVVDEHYHLTYSQLNRGSNQIAHYLRQLGVTTEKPVGVCLERGVELITILLGIVKAGGVYVPLELEYPAERLRSMAGDANVQILLTHAGWRDQFAGFPGCVVCLDEPTHSAAIQSQSETNPQVFIDPTNLIYILYTSGSTGKPKGVAVDHRAVMRLIKNTNLMELGPKEVFLQVSLVSFDASTLEIWGSLLSGARLAVMPNGMPTLKDLGTTLRKYGVTAVWLTAGLFHMMVRERLNDLKTVRQVIAGGDVLNVADFNLLLEGNGDRYVISGCGPTENTTFTFCAPMKAVGQVLEHKVPLGLPITNTSVYVVDTCGQLAPIGVPGEVWTGGDGLARCYYSAPDLTATKFCPDPFSGQPGARLYRTGDLVRWREDGQVEFLGRVDHQVKIRNFRVEPAEVERAISSHPDVIRAAVTVRGNSSRDRRLVAHVIAKSHSDCSPESLREYLARNLPEHMIPSSISFVDEFPLTPSGKFDLMKLPEQAIPPTVHIAPKTEMERAISVVWSELLGVADPGTQDNFFDLGGHSMLAIQVHERLQQCLGIQFPLLHLFRYSTIGALAGQLSGAAQADDSAQRLRERAAKQIQALRRRPATAASRSRQ